MKAPFSSYLQAQRPKVKELVSLLQERFDYISVLATDSKGFTVRISTHNKALSNENIATERGFVVRAYKDGLYSEYAFNELDEDIHQMAKTIMDELDKQFSLLKLTNSKVYETGCLPDEPIELFVEKETKELPEETDLEGLVKKFTGLVDEGMKAHPNIVNVQVSAQSTHVSKMFITKNRDMCQSYVYSEGNMVLILARDGVNKVTYEGVSGLCGPEVFDEMPALLPELVKKGEDSLNSTRIIPGEYDVITTPGVTGLIAHEAFGHGVEMDMFVKKRALGAEYIDQRVGSDLVTMHEGATCAESVSSYAFDDEGTLAGDVIEIDHGILKTGICDALSAIRLGTKPTGNGKRENFEHKVYTRMTNTMFDSGEDTLEDMIASIEYGYLLDGMESGMEDPKHWGIQCIVSRGYEIKDGKLTGKVVSPVIMTGYVPDLLGSVSMASKDRVVDGNGTCGKGHKEWVKVADGGPYLKARARLG